MRSSITLMLGAALGATGLALVAAPGASDAAGEAEAPPAQAVAAAEAPQPIDETAGETADAIDATDRMEPATTEDAEPPVPAAPAEPAAPERTEPELAIESAADVEPYAQDAELAIPATEAAQTASLDPEETADAADPASEVEADGLDRQEALVELSELGGVGYDSQGRRGRIHVVVAGDTLWDISDAYLGTPWVWPSIWQDNGEIDNPHLIYPGARIWITKSEMRRVGAEEAAALLAGQPAPSDGPASADDEPFAPIETPGEPEQQMAALPGALTGTARARTRRVSSRDAVGLVTAEVFDASASVVDSELDKVMLSQGDRIYIGLGAGDVREDDEFTVFRKQERVFDPDTGRLLGYHVDVLGWISVVEIGEEASLAQIEVSHAEIERGDRLMPREEIPLEIAMQPSPGDVEGRISFFSQSRTMMGMVDYVYLNRGTLDGLEVGSPLEVYRIGPSAVEVARRTRVKVPDRVIADLLVVRAEPNSSVAYVTHASTEVELGDHFRGSAAATE